MRIACLALSGLALNILLQISPAIATGAVLEEGLFEDAANVSTWSQLPTDITYTVCQYIDENSLISLRKVDTTTNLAVDLEFKRRSKLKTPLTCLISPEKSHSTPHTVSYFLRKLLRQLPEFLVEEGENSKRVKIYSNCAEFCKTWKCPAEYIFRLSSRILAKDESKESRFQLLSAFLKQYLSDTLDNSNIDVLELKLYSLSCMPVYLADNPLAVNDFCTYSKLLLNQGADDVASYYLFQTGCSLVVSGQPFKAKTFYRMAADQGLALAHHNIGYIFHEEGDLDQAKTHFKLAASQGILGSQLNLAGLFVKERDFTQAMIYYKMACDQGHAMAQCNVGSIYYNEGNIERAKAYLKLAADQGYAEAQYLLGAIHNKEGNVGQGRILWKSAADSGEANYQYNYGLFVFHEGNILEAKKYLIKAAYKGLMDAQLTLGIIYYNEGNSLQAKKFYKMAADQGSIDAKWNLANLCHMEGDVKKTIVYLKQLAAQGHEGAKKNLIALLK